ncbi:MAG: hypothetical protein AAGG01_06115 [Planctomycetota bacterium]
MLSFPSLPFTRSSTLYATILFLGGAVAPSLEAQSAIVPDSTVRTVVSVSLADGSVEAAGFLDLDDGAIPANRPYAGALVGDELWFTDDITTRVTRWNAFGTVQLGAIDLAPHRLRGIAVGFGAVWVGAGNPSGTVPDFLVEISPAGSIVNFHPMPGLVNGVTVLGSSLLVAIADTDSLLLVDPSTGAVSGTFHDSNGIGSIDSPGDLDVLPNGHVLAGGGLDPFGVFEYDAAGNEVGFVSSAGVAPGGGVRGVQGLANGDIVFSAAAGLYRWSRATGQIDTLAESLTLYYFNEVPSIPLGTSECGPAVVNSTGKSGTTTAVGSRILSDSAVRLCAQDLPIASTGYFLCSRTQGFVPMAGGAQGTLCLGGAVGRFNQQIGFTAGDGFFSITVDATQIPQPNGFIPIMAGETWRFQCWYRDANPGITSNFTDATAVTFQ